MQNKIRIILSIFIILFSMISSFSIAFARDEANLINTDTTTELLEVKESTKSKLDTYIEKYGTVPYGVVAYILHGLQIASIPTCFLGIAFGTIKQYVTGIRRADTRDRGLYMVIIFVTILLIFQVMPLIFAIIVRGWRG